MADSKGDTEFFAKKELSLKKDLHFCILNLLSYINCICLIKMTRFKVIIQMKPRCTRLRKVKSHWFTHIYKMSHYKSPTKHPNNIL